MKSDEFYQIVRAKLSTMKAPVIENEYIVRIGKDIAMSVKKEYIKDVDCIISFTFQTTVRSIKHQAHFKQNEDGSFRELKQIFSPLSVDGSRGLIDESIDEQWLFNGVELPKGKVVRMPYRHYSLHSYYKNEN